MFSGILKYIGVTNDFVSDAQRVEIAQKLLHQGLKRPELKDELYMQLIKQTRGNTNTDACLRAWEIFHLVSAAMPPSKVCWPATCASIAVLALRSGEVLRDVVLFILVPASRSMLT